MSLLESDIARDVTTADFTIHYNEAGPADAQVQRVAVCAGAGDDIFDAVRASGADVYLTSDLRHHPASEAREQAAGGPPYLVDVAHFASEWPWLPLAAADLTSALVGDGTTVETRISTQRTDPWTARVPSPQMQSEGNPL